MEPFQVKKIIFDDGDDCHGNSKQHVHDNLITFGNLDDLNRMYTRDYYGYGVRGLLRRRFHPGNYVFSQLPNEKSNLSIVIHHENVDPKAILKKLHEISSVLATKPIDGEETKVNAAIGDSKRSLIKSSDWFKKENRYGDGTSKFGKFDNDDHGRCDICDEIDHRLSASAFYHRSLSFDHRLSAIETGDHYVVHKIYDARIQYGDNPEEARSKASKYLDLLFVVNDLHWIEKKTEWKLTPIDDGNAYLVEFRDGEKIGYAFDVEQYFGNKNVRIMLLLYANDRPPAATPFALIFETEEASLIRPKVFIHRMSDFFYQSEYRQFVQNGQKQVNQYFGAQDDQSPFTNLPSIPFAKIMSYLTLKERVLVRRVSQRWLESSNDILAIRTKQIDLGRNDMIKNWTNADLNRMIPLVAGGLELLKVLNFSMPIQCDFGFIRPDVMFRSLREIDIGYFTLKFDLVKILMEKAPNLKKFAGIMQLNVNEEAAGDQCCFKSVEELILGRYGGNGAINMGDSYLMTLIDLFPNIQRLSLYDLHFVSASAASVMAERLAPKLERLEMRFATHRSDTRDEFEQTSIPPLGVFDGIGSCINLHTLILDNSPYISDGFTQALAKGCALLETLDLSNSLLPNGSSAPLEKLAALTKLTKLNVSNIDGVSDGLMAVVRKGRLEQLLLCYCHPSAELIKACVRYDAGLLLLDMRSDECTEENAIEILIMYGRYGCTQRMVIRTDNHVWLSAQVREMQWAIKNGEHPHRGSFVVDMRGSVYGFVENAAEEYETANPNALRLEDSDPNI